MTPGWVGDPRSRPKEYITIADVVALENASGTDSAVLVFGNATTGEVYGKGGMLFTSPGILSLPQLPTSSTGNTAAAQAVCWVRNDQWIALSIRDVRNQSSMPSNGGEIAIGITGSVLLFDKNGNVSIKNGSNTSLNIDNSGNVSLCGGGHGIAFADAILQELQNIAETLTSLAGQASFGKPYTPPTDASAIGSTKSKTG